MTAIRSFEFDLDDSSLAVELSDGTTRRDVVPPLALAEVSSIRHFRLDFAAGQLLLRLPNGRTAPVELAIPGYDDAALLAGRFVVYLDQNLWSTLAAARHGHRKVSEQDAAAAAALAQLVEQKHIVLPLSSSHFLETGRHLGPNRVPLASTLLELARGWQMRHPGMIGIRELSSALTGSAAPTPASIFTLQPNAVFLQDFPPPESKYPEPLGSVMSQVIAASGTYDAVIESPIPDEGSAAIVQRWVAAQDEVVKMLADDKASPDFVRRVALGRLLADYGEQGILRSGPGLGPEVFGGDALTRWLPRAADEIAQMPYLGRLWRLTYARLRNGAPWKPGDLADIHNLAAAAGYATVVAGEKRTIGDLRSAKQVTPGAYLATNLTEAVAAVLMAVVEQTANAAAA
jgi:hypothetical protein